MKNIMFLFILVYLFGCGGSGSDSSESFRVEEPISDMAVVVKDKSQSAEFNNDSEKMVSENEALPADVNKMLIKNGNIDIEVNNVNSAKDFVDSLIVEFKSYYSGEQLNKSDHRFDYNLTVRIPAVDFDKFLNKLKRIDGTITRQDISVQDVTSDYTDTEIRLANKTAYLVRYREILRQARTVKDILEVEEKIRVIEEEIDSFKGKLKYLSEQITFSTLQIDLYQINDTEMKLPDSFLSRFWGSIKSGWTGLTEFILIFVMLWPFLLIGIIIFFVLYKWARKTSKKKE